MGVISFGNRGRREERENFGSVYLDVFWSKGVFGLSFWFFVKGLSVFLV